MSFTALLLPRAPRATFAGYVLAAGEKVYATDSGIEYTGDGVTPGGNAVAALAAPQAAAVAVLPPLINRLQALPPSLADLGAVAYDPAHLVDSGAAIEAGLAAGVTDFSNATLYINSPRTIPAGARLNFRQGGQLIPSSDGYGNRRGTWVLGPNAAITVSPEVELNDPVWVSQDAAIPPAVTGITATDTAAAKARIAAWTGTAMTLDAVDITVRSPTIVGFAKGIVVANERILVEHPRVHCLNGIEVTAVHDVGYLLQPHLWPFWYSHIPSIGFDALGPLRTGLNLHDGADGFQIKGGLVFGWLISLHLSNVYAPDIEGLWIDGDPGGAAARGTIGILTEGDCGGTKLRGVHVDSHAYSRVLRHTGGNMLWPDNTSSGAQVQDTVLGMGHSDGSVTISNAAGSSLILGLAGIGLHDLAITAAGGVVPNLVDFSAVSAADQTRFRLMRWKNIGAPTVNNAPLAGQPLAEG